MERVRRRRDTPGSGSRIPGSLPSGAQKSQPAASSITQHSLVFLGGDFFSFFSSDIIWKHERSDGPLTSNSIQPLEDRANLASFPQCNILHHEVPAVTACGHKQPDKTKKNPTSLMASVSPKNDLCRPSPPPASTQKKCTENRPEEQHDRLRASTRPPNAAQPNVIGPRVGRRPLSGSAVGRRGFAKCTTMLWV